LALQRDQFAAFFAAVRPGQRPFAWQERLLDALLAQGRWPDRVVAPTGAGKTAVVDVHVFANALAAAGLAPRLPRRLVLVVDRRAVVDSHDEHARALARLLSAADDGLLAEMARWLRSLRLQLPSVDGLPVEDRPLLTARLRGGAPAPRSWRDAPEACAVITGTPDMIGSRLLLQGYGSSPRAWPREAGLLAFDAALIVDEAHLSRQFLATTRRVSLLATARLTGAVPVLQVVETTATPQQGAGTEVGVEPDDMVDPVLARRMRNPKPVTLLPVPTWPLAPQGRALDPLVEQVVQARRECGPTVGCVFNRVASAAGLARRLRDQGLKVELLVGRMRPADVSHLRRRRTGLLDIGGNDQVDVLVATQTIEVGIDLDLSALVTELAPGTALAQRSGRVNRRGDRTSPRVVVAMPETETVPEKATAPYEREDLDRARTWLSALVADPDGLTPWSLRAKPPPGEALGRPLLRRLEIADSWTWAATGDDLFERPDLDLWLADDLAADRDVGLVSRADLPVDPNDAVALLRLLPPRPHEVFPVPIGVMRALLPLLPRRLPVVRWRWDDVEAVSDDDVSVRIGDVFVVDASVPVQREGVVDAVSDRAPAGDVLAYAPPAPSGQVRPGHVVLRWGSLREAAGLLGPLPPEASSLLADGPTGVAGGWSRQQRRDLAGLLAQSQPARGLPDESVEDVEAMRDAAVELLRDGRVKDSALHVLPAGAVVPALLVVLDLRRAAADEDVRQTWTPSDEAVSLAQHAAAVAAAAESLGRSLGVGAAEVELLRLAGLHHDDGKADARFQAVLGRGPDEPPLAKSAVRPAASDAAARSASGLPSGWRHEQLSVLAAWRAVPESERPLVARFVGTTHGHGRSSFPHGATGLLGVPVDAVPPEARGLFDEGEWEQLVQDTDEQHGVWALAFLEALLRAADGRVSAAGS